MPLLLLAKRYLVIIIIFAIAIVIAITIIIDLPINIIIALAIVIVILTFINIIANIILIIVAAARKKVHHHKQTRIASEQTSKNRKCKRIQQIGHGRKLQIFTQNKKRKSKIK